MADHLSVVSNDEHRFGGSGGNGDNGTGDTGATRDRQPARPRPKRKLPTERLKIDKQTAALQAFPRASERGAYGVGAKQIAARINVAEVTAGLVNNFFVEAGFITPASKGKYRPVAEVIDYERAASFLNPNAPKILAGLLRDKWYFTSIQPELEGGRAVSRELLVTILGDAAGVGNERKEQLGMILEWLEYVGLIVEDGEGKIRLAVDDRPEDEAVEDGTQSEQTPPDDDGAKGQGSTPKRGDAPEATKVLAFKFEFSLTADDLKKLSPEQIAATFEAVGKVMAIKAKAGIE